MADLFAVKLSNNHFHNYIYDSFRTSSLVAACMDGQRSCSVSHVNAALVQPHGRTHDALLKQQALRRGAP